MNNLFKHIANLTKLALLCLSLCLIPIQSHARDVTFEWTSLPEPLTGYKIYRQVENSAFETPIVLGKVTTHTLTGLASDKSYNFYLTGYNQAGEGGASAIVTISPSSSQAPTIINISLK